MADLESFAFRLVDLPSLRKLVVEGLQFEYADKPVSKQNWTDDEKEIVVESKIIAEKNDFFIYYIQTKTDSLKHWKSIAGKIIKEKLGSCLVCSHNPSGFKWVFSSLSKEFSKSFSETRHVPIEIRPSIKPPSNFVAFLGKLKVDGDSTVTSIALQVSDAFDTFAVEIHNELTVNVYEALKTLSEGIIEDKSNNLSLSDETLEEIRPHIFTLLYRIIFILYAEDRGIFPVEDKDPTYKEEFSLKWIKEEWLLKVTNRKKLAEYQVQKKLKNLFKLIELGSEAFDYPKFSMRSYYGRLFDREINSKLESWKISNSHLLETLNLLTRTKDRSGNYFFLDYAALETRHLGAVYEHLLEFHLHVENGKIAELAESEERKMSGSYYTSKYIVDYITQNSIGPLIDKIINKNSDKQTQIEKVLELKIIDPAMGSGHFLVGATEYIAKRLCEIEFGEVTEQDYIERKREVVRKCIYGVDRNPLAVDLASLSLWLETLSSEKPLSFLRSHLKCGNSLVGSEIKSIFGEHDIHTKTSQTTLFESQGAQNAFKKNIKNFLMFENLKDDTPSAVKVKLEEYSKMLSQGTIYKDLQFLLNCKTAEYFGVKLPILFRDYTTKIGENSLDYYSDKDFQNIDTLTNQHTFFHWELEFPHIFYDENGNKRTNYGFNAVIGNPPWQGVKPDVDEFFTSLQDMQLLLVSKFPKTKTPFSKLNASDKKMMMGKCLKKENVRVLFEEYLTNYKKQMHYFGSSDKYTLQGVGDLNLYKLFVEKSLQIIQTNGTFGMVLPSGIYYDLGTKELRQVIFDKNSILELCGFVNKKPIFEDVHRQFKFCTFIFKKGEFTNKFLAKFFVLDDRELQNFRKTAIVYNLEFIKRSSPNYFTILESTNKTEQQIFEKLFSFPILEDPTWNFKPTRELDMTNDSDLFHTANVGFKPSSELHMTNDSDLFHTANVGPPLYEGKMIHMFTHTLAPPRYWLDKDKVEDRLKHKELGRIPNTIKKSNPSIPLKIHAQEYRLVWRSQANSTDTRTLISTILPPNVFLGNSLGYLIPIIFDNTTYVKPISNIETVFLCGMLNSFVQDFVIRHKISRNINYFHINGQPIPRFDKNNLFHQKLFKNSAMLICTTVDYAKLRDEIGVSEYVTKPAKRMVLEAQINAYAAKIYDLTREELEYILGTFSILNQELKVLTLEYFRKL